MALILKRTVKPVTVAPGETNPNLPDGPDVLAHQESRNAITDIDYVITPLRKEDSLPLEERRTASETTTQTPTPSAQHRLRGTTGEVSLAGHPVWIGTFQSLTTRAPTYMREAIKKLGTMRCRRIGIAKNCGRTRNKGRTRRASPSSKCESSPAAPTIWSSPWSGPRREKREPGTRAKNSMMRTWTKLRARFAGPFDQPLVSVAESTKGWPRPWLFLDTMPSFGKDLGNNLPLLQGIRNDVMQSRIGICTGFRKIYDIPLISIPLA